MHRTNRILAAAICTALIAAGHSDLAQRRLPNPLKLLQVQYLDVSSQQPLSHPFVSQLAEAGDDQCWAHNGTAPTNSTRQRQPPPNTGWPCSCQSLQCGCCTDIRFSWLGFQRNYCTNLTYFPNAFAVEMNVLQDDVSVYQNRVSGRNPSPLCLPIPYMPLDVDMCMKVFNVFTPGRNLHMCMDMMTRVMHAPVMVLHFDCMRMGADGVALVKPNDNGGLPRPPRPTEQQQQQQPTGR